MSRATIPLDRLVADHSGFPNNCVPAPGAAPDRPFFRSEKVKAAFNSDEFVGRSGPISIFFVSGDIGVVELPLQPFRRGRFPAFRRFDPSMEIAAAGDGFDFIAGAGASCHAVTH